MPASCLSAPAVATSAYDACLLSAPAAPKQVMCEPPPRPFLCAADCSKSHGLVDLCFGQRAPWTEAVGTVTPLACGHPVCLECVSARPELLACCAQCGFSATGPAQSTAGGSRRKAPRTTAQQQAGWATAGKDHQPQRQEDDVEEVAGVHPNIDVNEIACQVCGSGDDDAMMVLCDDCPRGFHTYCLSPPLQRIPSGDWFCPRCSAHREENKKRAMERAAEHWRNKRGSAAAASVSGRGGGTGVGADSTEDSESSPMPAPLPSPGAAAGLRSGFVEYCRKMQAALERTEPNLSRSAVLTKLASEWRGLSDAERRKYAAVAEKAKQQERLSAVAAEVSGAMSGIMAGPRAAAAAAMEDARAGTGDGSAAVVAPRPHGPVIPLFVRATRQVLEGSEYWLSLTPTGEGRLAVDWRIPDAATCVIIALGWAQGRPAYVERTDSSAVRECEGVVHFTEAHIARFAGGGSSSSRDRDAGAGVPAEDDIDGAAVVISSSSVKEARPLVMRLWRDTTFGDHGERGASILSFFLNLSYLVPSFLPSLRAYSTSLLV
jgi:hypothetical protein